MKAYPIIFSAPMVKALLDGTKTQTRRPAERFVPAANPPAGQAGKVGHYVPAVWQRRHDKFQAGEQPWLWVKETHWGCDFQETGDLPIVVYEERHHSKHYDHPGNIMVRAGKFGHIPSIHMPKRASRISLRVIGMRIERLTEISEQNATAEGVIAAPHDHRDAFAYLWDGLHGEGAFNANPSVVVTEFEVHRQSIGSVT